MRGNRNADLTRFLDNIEQMLDTHSLARDDREELVSDLAITRLVQFLLDVSERPYAMQGDPFRKIVQLDDLPILGESPDVKETWYFTTEVAIPIHAPEAAFTPEWPQYDGVILPANVAETVKQKTKTYSQALKIAENLGIGQYT